MTTANPKEVNFEHKTSYSQVRKGGLGGKYIPDNKSYTFSKDNFYLLLPVLETDNPDKTGFRLSLKIEEDDFWEDDIVCKTDIDINITDIKNALNTGWISRTFSAGGKPSLLAASRHLLTPRDQLPAIARRRCSVARRESGRDGGSLALLRSLVQAPDVRQRRFFNKIGDKGGQPEHGG